VIGGFLHGWYGERAFLFPAGLAALLAVVSLVLTVLLKDTPYVSGLAAPQPDAHPEAKPTATVPAAT
jgi:hypothetical protein